MNIIQKSRLDEAYLGLMKQGQDVISGLIPEAILSKDDFDILNAAGLIVPADKGGLLLGNDYVFVLQKRIRQGDYQFMSTPANIHWEGFQFVLNPAATFKMGIERIKEINGYADMDKVELFTPYEIPEHIRLIDARNRIIENELYPVFVLQNEMVAIINKLSAREFLPMLNKKNEDGLKVMIEIKKNKQN